MDQSINMTNRQYIGSIDRIQVDTPSMARRKEELEARLAEVNQHRALFLKPTVYLVDDEEEEHQERETEGGRGVNA